MAPFAVRALFAATAFVAAALVFLVQPMVAKQLLPTFGGTPAVWNTAVVCFQLLLLGGYAIAHVSLHALGPRRQPLVQLALGAAALAFLPFAVRSAAEAPDGLPPAAWVAVLLVTSVGVPYLAVTTASPVLQRWYAELGLADSADPYFLYTASNAGSLVGLLAFPFLLEPRLATSGQERVWLFAFVAYLLGATACAVVVRRRAPAATSPTQAAELEPRDTPSARVSRLRAVRWVAVAAVPSAAMLGVTTFVTTDVASAPLLWVVPLALYLISFMLTFGRRVRIGPRLASVLAAAAMLALLLVELGAAEVEALGRVITHLLAMTAVAVLCHAWLYADRPPARQLTTFYLLLSVGGALGGIATALVAPVVFDGVFEYPLVLAAALLVRRRGWDGPGRWREAGGWRALVSVLELSLAAGLVFAFADEARGDAGLVWATPALVAFAGFLLLAVRRWGFVLAVTTLLALLTFSGDQDTTLRERNFFGTLRVATDTSRVRLLHGTTLHGTQLRGEGRQGVPTSYYGRVGPLGDVFEYLQRDEPFVHVGAVGLGTGSVVAHARLWQRFTFYEIDPAVIRVARDERHFSYLSDAQVDVDVVEGDARLELERARTPKFDLLVLDAYSSDAVPVHLLTVEAFSSYLDRLAPGGSMALHVSSRHLELAPIVAANARRLGLAAMHRDDDATTLAHARDSLTSSHWIVLAREERDLAPLDGVREWEPLRVTGEVRAWTDDYSNLASAITWLPDALRR